MSMHNDSPGQTGDSTPKASATKSNLLIAVVMITVAMTVGVMPFLIVIFGRQG